jgi:hypothetical protein
MTIPTPPTPPSPIPKPKPEPSAPPDEKTRWECLQWVVWVLAALIPIIYYVLRWLLSRLNAACARSPLGGPWWTNILCWFWIWMLVTFISLVILIILFIITICMRAKVEIPSPEPEPEPA